LQTIETDEEEPSLFSHVLALPKLFTEEIRYSTQEILVEILARFYHVYSKKDAKKFAQLKKALPVVLLDALQDPSRGIKAVLQDLRCVLTL
jgi:hypothetical protein